MVSAREVSRALLVLSPAPCLPAAHCTPEALTALPVRRSAIGRSIESKR
jgi:hypothetical protein